MTGVVEQVASEPNKLESGALQIWTENKSGLIESHVFKMYLFS